MEHTKGWLDRVKEWAGFSNANTKVQRTPMYAEAVLARSKPDNGPLSREHAAQWNEKGRIEAVGYDLPKGNVPKLSHSEMLKHQRSLEKESLALQAKQQQNTNALAGMKQHGGNVRDATSGKGITPRELSKARERLNHENTLSAQKRERCVAR